MRAAAASAKQSLLAMAATSLGVPVASLTVTDGVVSGGGKTVSYGQLIGDKLFNGQTVAATLNPGQAPAKSPGAVQLVGTSPPRIDIPDKVTGKFTYVHNVRVAGDAPRPRRAAARPGAYGDGPRCCSVDESSIKSIPDAQVVRRGDFIAVVAPKEYDAIQAAASSR